MRRSNFALRLQPSLLEEARKAAQSEGVALNQLISIAVAEKVSVLRTEDYFRERASRADRNAALLALGRAGKGNPPLLGDEISPGAFHVRRSIKRAKASPRKSRKRRASNT